MGTHSSILAGKIPCTEEPTVHGVTKSWLRLKRLSTHTYGKVLFLPTLIFKFLKPYSEKEWTTLITNSNLQMKTTTKRSKMPNAIPNQFLHQFEEILTRKYLVKESQMP